jgi:hypothetical protein
MSDENGKGESKSLAELAVHRRQEVRRKTNLSDAGKLLFDDLTDLCFLDKYSVGFGVVRIGKPLLAERLGCSVPTVTRAQRALTSSELWTKTGWYEGHEITIWFLRGIASGQLEFDQFTQGVTQTPHTRVAPRTSKVRNGHGQFCRLDHTPDLLENTEAMAELTVHPGQFCRVAPVSSAVATRSELTVGNGQKRPSGHGRTDRSQRSELTGANGQNHRAGPSKTDLSTTAGLTGYKDRDERKGDIRSLHPPTNGKGKVLREDSELAEWRQSLNGSFPSRLEKLRDKVIGQRNAATVPNIRAFIGRKIRILNELLDGPMPPAADPAPEKPRPARKAEKPLTPEELLESARNAVALGAKYLTPEQKAALEAAA